MEDGSGEAPSGRTALERLAGWLERRARERRPLVVGLTGPVATGKSRLADDLRLALERLGRPAEIVHTDGYLLANAVLDARGLTLRKGFPESFDDDRLARALTKVRAGPIRAPIYSHATYDVDGERTQWVNAEGVVIFEGLGLAAHLAALDALIYLDADETAIEHWFLARFMTLWRAAETDRESFYARFLGLGEAGAERFGREVWTTINLPNIKDNIVPLRARATVVVEKAPDHAIRSLLFRDASVGPAPG